MAKIDITDVVDYPLEEVYTGFRDHLSELQPYLPTIDDIIVESYERVDDETVEIVNIWKAADEDVPRLAQKFIKPEMLQWIDRATWHDDEFMCEWDMEVGFLKDAITCSGSTTYTRKGDVTNVQIRGDLKVDARHIPGVPRLVAGKVGDTVEKFVIKMITPNMTEVNRGLEKYLDAKA